MAKHEQVGSHATWGAVMKGPKGGTYVIFNGNKYYLGKDDKFESASAPKPRDPEQTRDEIQSIRKSLPFAPRIEPVRSAPAAVVKEAKAKLKTLDDGELGIMKGFSEGSFGEIREMQQIRAGTASADVLKKFVEMEPATRA
jgi:hypothetical protein